MDPATVIAVIALIGVVGWAVRYLFKSRKQNVGCIGCPLAAACASGPQTALRGQPVGACPSGRRPHNVAGQNIAGQNPGPIPVTLTVRPSSPPVVKTPAVKVPAAKGPTCFN
ncbi:MAG: FeoB-associated Cys-rich membrane protein [Actinomycetaceae bacterium]|nr:FeoB-associated Cys-rich membrane protein [Actinomycetaceae bacterium]